MPSMNTPSAFEQLLVAASAQPDPQVLLFVFAAADLPADATPAQRRRLEQAAGGALTPLMCVEKVLGELSTFEALVAESREVGPPWQVVFATGLAGSDGRLPSGPVVEGALKTLVDRVRRGAVGGLLALSTTGEVPGFA